jgi:dTMP kinase
MTAQNGLLVSVEGINGVGKSHLTYHALKDGLEGAMGEIICLDGFSQRSRSTENDLSRRILAAMISAADGDPFLRGGHPLSETLLLLAIKAFDWESNAAAYTAGAVVLEGRSLHTVAVYQSLILHPDDDTGALTEAQRILETASWWRPLPDLTILIIDDPETAIARLERRDQRTCDPAQRTIHFRAARLFEALAEADHDRIVVLDRRVHDQEALVRRIRTLISGHADSEHLAS